MEKTIRVSLEPASQSDRLRAGELLKRYIHEMVAFTATPDLTDEQLAAHIGMLHRYWEQEDHFPFLIFCDEELAGFSLVRRYPAEPGVYDMGQFFELDQFKGQGVGRRAFQLTLANFPGKWLTRVLLANERAFAFWKNVIGEQTCGNYALTRELDKGQEMNFIRFDA